MGIKFKSSYFRKILIKTRRQSQSSLMPDFALFAHNCKINEASGLFETKNQGFTSRQDVTALQTGSATWCHVLRLSHKLLKLKYGRKCFSSTLTMFLDFWSKKELLLAVPLGLFILQQNNSTIHCCLFRKVHKTYFLSSETFSFPHFSKSLQVLKKVDHFLREKKQHIFTSCFSFLMSETILLFNFYHSLASLLWEKKKPFAFLCKEKLMIVRRERLTFAFIFFPFGFWCTAQKQKRNTLRVEKILKEKTKAYCLSPSPL